MPRGTTLRNVRIDDELWERARQKAEEDGVPGISSAVRALLEAWVDGEIDVRMPETV